MAGISQEFKDQMQRLSKYFGKPVNKDQKSEYLKSAGHIPIMAMTDIVDELIRGRRPTPGSFPTPQRIITLWFEWQKKNPSKIEKRFEFMDCADCNQTGMIWYRLFEKDLDYKVEMFFLCANCQNWKQHFQNSEGMVFKYRRDLVDFGYDLFPYLT